MFNGITRGIVPNKGINDAQGPENIDDSEVVAAQNVRFWRGDVIQRGGFTPYIGSVIAAAPTTGIFQTNFSNGVSRLIAAAGSALVKDGGSGAWTSIKGALTLSAGQNNLFSFAVLNDLVIGCNGVNQLWQYSDSNDPATALTGTPPALANAIMSYQNRIHVFTGGVIQWCSLNNPNDWTSSSSGSATPLLKTGQDGRALAKVSSAAFAFYENTIMEYVPTGDSNKPYGFRIKAADVGAQSQQSTVVVPDREQLFFIGLRGIYTMSLPYYLPVRISEKIDGTWATVNKSRLKYACAQPYPDFNEVWFSVSTGSSTTNNLVLIYNYDKNVWTTFSGVNANALASFVNSTTGQTRVIHGDYAGSVHTNESGLTDNGTAIDAFITSKAYPVIDGAKPGRVTKMRARMDAQGAGATFEFSYGYDLQGIFSSHLASMDPGGAAYDSAVWDQDSFVNEGQVISEVIVADSGRFFQWQIRNRMLGNTFRLYSVDMDIVPPGRRQKAA